ncbi:MAG: hypothetical protein CMK74_21250 [Pseudomonadales bacterium]|nr:hypothetical protein [Pseudomonadales bacterium]
MTNPSAPLQAPIHQACALGKVTETTKSGAAGQLLRDRGAVLGAGQGVRILGMPRQQARSSDLGKLAQ